MASDFQSRRDFVKKSSLAAGIVLTNPLKSAAFTDGSDTIKIGLIGCGGRGTGAANQALSQSIPAKVVAMADAFGEKLQTSYDNLVELHGKEKVDVPKEHMFVGLDGYKEVIKLADVVFLATPPGFRPLHFEEVVRQGKHCFVEKPVATDVAGVKKMMELGKQAEAKGLKVVVGHHLRFQKSLVETVERLHDGAIGDLTSMNSYFNSQGVWVRPRKPGMTEMEYQVWNWYYFNWLSGDHIVEQHVHNLDFINWVKGMHPVKAQGMGGREVRTGKEYGQIYDHHYVEYEYPDGSILNSQCRHQPGTYQIWADRVWGTKGYYESNPGPQIATIFDSNLKELYRYHGKEDPSARQVEQDVLMHKIYHDEPINQIQAGAESTMTAILGRMATYSGQKVEWDQAMASNEKIVPDTFNWEDTPPVVPDQEGSYPVPVPGETKVF